MNVVQTADQIRYPETDGKPMGETDLHIEWLIRIRDILRYRYAGQRVYVGSDLLVYYEEGDPTKFVVPDHFVVRDCDPGPRRTFKIWEEGRSPEVVLEITSRGSRQEDEVFKPRVYARLGVREYFVYDPTNDYLDPPLQGFRLQEGGYKRIEPEAGGAMRCKTLGIGLRLEAGSLVLYDTETGAVLPTEAEATKAAREAEKAARQAAEARVAELEAELERLRDALGRR